jgi:hypothetical protein
MVHATSRKPMNRAGSAVRDARARLPRILRVDYPQWLRGSGVPVQPGALQQATLHARAVLEPAAAQALAEQVMAAKRHWRSDFGGEQFSLGRAFYTHQESGQAAAYFQATQASDASVEAILPGMQQTMRALLGQLLGGEVRQRYGFAGAGVHIFPSGERVATRSGVVHYDVQGLAPVHLREHSRTATLVLMLQPALRGGGLRVHEAHYAGHEHASEAERASPARTIRYAAGDAVLIASTRLHQIRKFSGQLDRISVTLHAVETVQGIWDTWY